MQTCHFSALEMSVPRSEGACESNEGEDFHPNASKPQQHPWLWRRSRWQQAPAAPLLALELSSWGLHVQELEHCSTGGHRAPAQPCSCPPPAMGCDPCAHLSPTSAQTQILEFVLVKSKLPYDRGNTQSSSAVRDLSSHTLLSC